ncbi:hypothetical protein BCV69DRAFT_190563 [Microstroma glucosiphilum]|uniref:Uncharacterized protein n=1 Tax=Pseudomicrostroma glucosiphilum TaxID=1684307 RepID=A0A316U7J4_9BASI|nr:hypothetical protein BCV69DRAFT_190563 [Pseudomicrostroma glucosiphilum]PWN21216.1 hypothetical protein BCV69DRAFT_190563 [Pseudomicrostroma glucosiphilum]
MSRPHQPDNVRKRFATYSTRSLGWLRSLEARFMHAGKVGDMLVLPLVVEQEEEKAEGIGAVDRVAPRRKRSSEVSSRSAKRRTTGSTGAPSPGNPSPASSGPNADSSTSAGRGSASEYPDIMNNGLQLPPIWSNTPQANNGWSPRAQAPMSFSRTGSNPQGIPTADLNALFGSSPSASWSTATPPSKSLNGSSGLSNNGSISSGLTPLPPFDSWPPQKEGGSAGGGGGSDAAAVGGGAAETANGLTAPAVAMGTGNLDFASMDSVDLSRLLFDFDVVPNLNFMEGWT